MWRHFWHLSPKSLRGAHCLHFSSRLILPYVTLTVRYLLLCVFNNNEKSVGLIQATAWVNTDNILSERSHPDHMHIWCFKSIQDLNTRESLNQVSRKKKENQIRMKEVTTIELGQLVKVEVDLWIRWLEDSFIILISGIYAGFLGEYPCLGSNTLEYFVWRGKYEYFESCYWTFSVSWKWLKNKLLLKTTMSIGQKSQDNIKHG